MTDGCLFEMTKLRADAESDKSRFDRFDAHKFAGDHIDGHRTPSVIPIEVGLVFHVPCFQ